MLHIFYVTFQMMALTFVIGFVVAAIIKSIAYATDNIELYNAKKEEIDRIERIRSQRFKRVKRTFADENRSWVERDYGISRGRVVQELNDEALKGVSKGRPDFDINQYYYAVLPGKRNRIA
ncbi:MAG: hypothetical protein LLG05_13995 [Porphyromonadaceae bacterium]|nr:hypothetical protein [uncultured Macellibacteroides sp.]MCE5226952.1 hypothetical protein [Porphyromonadaceae bacterium]